MCQPYSDLEDHTCSENQSQPFDSADEKRSKTLNMCYANEPTKENGAMKSSMERSLLRQRGRGEGSTCSVSSAKENSPEIFVRDELENIKSDQLFGEHPLHSVPVFLLIAAATKEFSIVFPYVLAPWAATRTYIPASYEYDEDNTHFDNSAWTWGTDYFLASLMTYFAIRCLRARSGCNLADSASHSLRVRSALLLLMYAVSTLAGAIAHQFYTSIDMMNTASFRILWTVCVGFVCAAGGMMGSIGSAICRGYRSNASKDEILLKIPVIPEWFWVCWGLYISGVCAMGTISYKRPACDIFIAGTTQLAPTTYCILALFTRRWGDDGHDMAIQVGVAASRVTRLYRLLYYIGFVANSPLLPLYPLLVQYTDWSLGTINTLLHSWLTVSWGMQALSLRHLCLALNN
eukprot:CAMPEP_0183290970 /NCGR_PEP_ID=MMETSP0160_2-20130417/534_1 /TAXON_ID=2839 ORGANISM="Odontella Sinensis, Strain Grunow 1884" /NCGR_SAMPLE_ID=MMETSP0160_2 /ASSEMBLY_ACC=CAM_ASM_000250 /LENGTH=403 /DNA_ID=CAMNT_0025451699 /DNA_START=169 /DNA_END=1380 /DNA_ORIENTATION=+